MVGKKDLYVWVDNHRKKAIKEVVERFEQEIEKEKNQVMRESGIEKKIEKIDEHINEALLTLRNITEGLDR